MLSGAAVGGVIPRRSRHCAKDRRTLTGDLLRPANKAKESRRYHVPLLRRGGLGSAVAAHIAEVTVAGARRVLGGRTPEGTTELLRLCRVVAQLSDVCHPVHRADVTATTGCGRKVPLAGGLHLSQNRRSVLNVTTVAAGR